MFSKGREIVRICILSHFLEIAASNRARLFVTILFLSIRVMIYYLVLSTISVLMCFKN